MHAAFTSAAHAPGMSCCQPPLSRRQLLRLGAAMSAAAAASPLLAGRAAAAPAARGAAGAVGSVGSTGPVPQDAELVTVTDTSVIVTWFTGDGVASPDPSQPRPAPVPADTVLVVTDPATGRVAGEVRRNDQTAYHYAEVTGLAPGHDYTYAASSAGLPATSRVLPILDVSLLNSLFAGGAVPTVQQVRQAVSFSSAPLASPGVVTTLVPPGGPLLFTIALANDVHIGETRSGIITGDSPPSFSTPGYPDFMATAMVTEARSRGADVLLVAGDVTSEAQLVDVRQAKTLLDGFGTLRSGGQLGSGDYVVARGNHDRPHVGQDYAGCPPTSGSTDHHDCLIESFDLTRQEISVSDVGGLRVIGLDTTSLDASGGTMSDAQLAALAVELRRAPNQPTLLFGHHPVTAEAAATTFGGPTFDLDQTIARKLEALYAAAPGVFFHHAGHTHRNRRTAAPVTAPGVEFLEVSATKEYPGGYSLVRVHAGGYQVNYYKTSADAARAWSTTTAGEYYGTYPAYTLGSTADRNHVVARDLTSLRAVAPAAALPEGPLALALPLAAVGLGAAAVLAQRGRPT